MKWALLCVAILAIAATAAADYVDHEANLARYQEELRVLQERQASIMSSPGFSMAEVGSAPVPPPSVPIPEARDHLKMAKLNTAMKAVKEDIMAKLREAQRESQWVKEVEALIVEYKKKVKNVKKNLVSLRQQIKGLIVKKRQIRNAQIQEQLRDRLTDASGDLKLVDDKLELINTQQKAFEDNRKKIVDTIAKIDAELKALRGQPADQAKAVTDAKKKAADEKAKKEEAAKKKKAEEKKAAAAKTDGKKDAKKDAKKADKKGKKAAKKDAKKAAKKAGKKSKKAGKKGKKAGKKGAKGKGKKVAAGKKKVQAQCKKTCGKKGKKCVTECVGKVAKAVKTCKKSCGKKGAKCVKPCVVKAVKALKGNAKKAPTKAPTKAPAAAAPAKSDAAATKSFLEALEAEVAASEAETDAEVQAQSQTEMSDAELLAEFAF